jgi:hypothetical protein
MYEMCYLLRKEVYLTEVLEAHRHGAYMGSVQVREVDDGIS